MVVDDDPRIVRFMRLKLITSGFEVSTAGSGEEALEMMGDKFPDIIVLDIIMPGIDGFEVLRRLREGSDVPVIAFSARPENSLQALKLGADDFITKPFDVDDLVQRVRQLLKSR
jgi:two-component system KDP operon response regulator KdpE